MNGNAWSDFVMRRTGPCGGSGGTRHMAFYACERGEEYGASGSGQRFINLSKTVKNL